jgi:hypothetical protein
MWKGNKDVMNGGLVHSAHYSKKVTRSNVRIIGVRNYLILHEIILQNYILRIIPLRKNCYL